MADNIGLIGDDLLPIGAQVPSRPDTAPAVPATPSWGDTLGASWRQDNLIGSVINRKDLGVSNELEPNYNPWDEIKDDPKYRDRWSSFVDVNNPRMMVARKAQIDMEDNDRRTLAAAGWRGMLTSLGAGIADPTILIPGAGYIKAVKGGYSVSRAALDVAIGGALGAAAQEAGLQATQETRPWEDSAIAIGGGFVLGGLLGGGARMLSPAEARTAERGFRVLHRGTEVSTGGLAVASGGELADIAARVRAGERVPSNEVVEAARVASLQARSGRELTPEVEARVDAIDRLVQEVERETVRARSIDLETSVRQAFGSDGARILEGGGVKVVQSVEDLPARPDGTAHPNDVRGVFDGKTAYLVADNVAPGEVKGVLLHEVGVHYGMQRMLGDVQFQQLLDDVTARAQAGEARFAEAMAAVPKDTPPQHVAEEVLAYLVENAPEAGIVQRVIATVKQFVREVFGGKITGLSEEDIRALAVSALRKWKPDAQPSVVRQPRYSITPEQDAALRDMVRYSRGKDATYAPLDRLVDSDRIPTISIKDLRGRTIFPTIADRTAAGALYKGIDGSELNMAVHLPGGPNYPFRENNMEAGVVWANKGKGVSATKAERAKQGQLMAVMLGDANMHQSNSTVSKAFFQTMDAYVRDGRIEPKNIAKIDAYVRETFEDFPGIKNAEAFDQWVDDLSFEDRKRLIQIMGGKKVQGLGGPSLDRVLDATRDTEYAGNRWGDAVVIVEPDPSQPLVRLGTEGTTEHPDYPTGIRGRVVGKLRTPINYEALYADFLSKAKDEAVARGTKENKINTRRAFELGKPALEITDDLIKRLEPVEATAIRNAREAKLTAAFGADKWKTSGIDKNKGGISPQEFVDAIAQSPASATLTKYTASEVNKAVKAGDMRVFQLGEDGRVWFALKKGDPASGYDLDPKAFKYGDKEVTLTSVVNNEQGVRGIPGEAVMLKAIQEGATALDAFAVQSDKYPKGFLPTYYRRFGFEEVGRTKFDPSFYDANQLKDLEKFWSSTGWKKGDAYPDVVFMKWSGTDAERGSFAKRYVGSGPEGLSNGRTRGNVARAEADAPDARLRDAGRRAEPLGGAGRGDQGNAGGSGTSRLGQTLNELKGLSDTALRNFGLTRADIDALKYSRGGNRNDRIAERLDALAKAIDSIDDPAAFASAMGRLSAGGADIAEQFSREDVQTYGKGARAVERALAPINPILRASQRAVAYASEVMQRLYEDTSFKGMHFTDKTLGPSVETLIREEQNSAIIAVNKAHAEIYSEMRKSGIQMTKQQFSEAITKAGRRGDVGDNEFITKAAQIYRTELFDRFLKKAQDTNKSDGQPMLPADVKALGAKSYVTRMPDRKRLVADEQGFKEAVAGYMHPVLQKDYAESARATKARIARLDQERSDLLLSPEARAAELEAVDAKLADMETMNAREIDLLAQINKQQTAAANARERGDKKAAKAAKEEAARLFALGGDGLKAFMKERGALRSRRSKIDLNYAGLQERSDRIAQTIADIEESNLRQMNRLIDRGRKAEREMAKLDPAKKVEKIAALRTQFADVAARSEKAADSLAERAKAIAAEEIAALQKAIQDRKAGTGPKAKASDPPADVSQYVSAKKYNELLSAPYSRDGEVIASSRTVPFSGELPPVGSWRISDYATNYGREIEQLRRVKIDDLKLPELRDGALDVAKRGDDETYAKWIAEGKRPPPIEVVAREDGTLAVVDGHRRVLAAKKAGQKEVEAWVSDLTDSPTAKMPDGTPIKTTLTYELAQSKTGKTDKVAQKGKALAEAIKKNAVAERARSERLNSIARRLEEAEALDPDAQIIELRRALDEMAAQVSGSSLDKGAKAQRLIDRAKRLDPARLDERVKAIDALRKSIEDDHYQRWAVAKGGENVDIDAVAKPDFSALARDIADQAFDFYTGRGKIAGTVPDFAMPLTSGPMKERTLPVPDTILEPWLENDITTIARHYARTMASQIEMTRKFGRADMAEQQEKLKLFYRDLRAQVSAARTVEEATAIVGRQPAALDALKARLRGDDKSKVTKEGILDWLTRDEKDALEDMIAGRDQILGKRNTSDYDGIVRNITAFNYISKMGGALIANLSDVYRPAMVHGLGRFMSDGIKPLVGNLEAFREVVKEGNLAGIGEKWLNAHTANLGELADPYAKGSAFDRLMQNASKLASKWNGLELFTTFEKDFGSVVVQARILKAAVKGNDKPYMRMLGIDPFMQQRIADQFAAHGRTMDGVRVAKTEDWTDAEAVKVYRAAISKDVATQFNERSAGDVAHFFHTPVGRLIGQFRTFNLAANQRILMRGLQDEPARLLGSVVAMTTIGMLVATLRSWNGGQDRWEKFKASAENPGFLIGEGLDNSGIFTLLFEGANTIEKFTQPSGINFNPVKTPLMAMFPNASQQGESARFAARDPLSAVLGPSASLPMAAARSLSIGKAIYSGEDVKKGDMSTLISQIPYGSYLGPRQLIQMAVGDSPYDF